MGPIVIPLMPRDVASSTRTTANSLFRASNETCVIYVIRQIRKLKMCVE